MKVTTDNINYKTSWLIAETRGRSHVIRVLHDIRRRFQISGKDVLELGCGIGTNLLIFTKDNRVRGIEGLESAVYEARAQGIDTIQANLEGPLPIEDKCADWVLCIDVLEHLLNPPVCLAAAHRTLRDGGHLIVNVPNHFDWRGRVRVLFGSGIDSQKYFPDSPHWAYPHVRFFQRATIEVLLKESGFVVVEDLSPRFITFPKAEELSRAGLCGPIRSLQRRWPDLFSAGFFLLCQKTS